jgi:hypothetical protein
LDEVKIIEDVEFVALLCQGWQKAAFCPLVFSSGKLLSPLFLPTERKGFLYVGTDIFLSDWEGHIDMIVLYIAELSLN